MTNIIKHDSAIGIASAIGVATTSNLINYSKYQEISHQSHITIASGLTAAIVAGTSNYKKFKADELSKKLAIKNSVKITAQGLVSATTVTTAANYVVNNNYLGAMATIGLGAIGVFAVDKLYDTAYDKFNKINNRKKEEEK